MPLPAGNDIDSWIKKCNDAINAPAVTAPVVTPKQPVVTLSASHDKISLPSLGGSKTINVYSNSSWRVFDSPSWCTVDRSSGSNNGSITISCESNTMMTQRVGTLTLLAGNNAVYINVDQAEGIPDNQRIRITGVEFADKDKSGTVISDFGSTLYTTTQYLAPKVTYLNLVPEAKKIRLDYRIIDPNGTTQKGKTSPDGYTYYTEIPVSGDMSGAKYYGLLGWGSEAGTAYQTPGNYTFEIWCAGEMLYRTSVFITKTNSTTTQAVVAAATALAVSSSELSFTSDGGNNDISVTTNAASYDVKYLPAWCTVGRSGNTITIRCSANTSTQSRKDWFEITAGEKSERIYILQAGRTVALSLNASSSSLTFSGSGGSQTVAITTNADNFEVRYVPSWCSVSKSSGRITVTCNYNHEKSARHGAFEVYAGTKSITIAIAQPAVKARNPFAIGSTGRAGVSFGYVQKHWKFSDGVTTEKYGFWDNTSSISGYQAGVRINSYFSPKLFGLGLTYGAFYEYYQSGANVDLDGETYYVTFKEHSIYVPLHLTYRVDFTRQFGIFISGGLGADYGIEAKLHLDGETSDGLYDETFKRFNLSGEFGGGIRYGVLNFSAVCSTGLLDQAEKGAGYTKKQNKGLMLTLGLIF